MSESATGDAITVLICDDSQALRSLLAIMIELRDGMSLVGEAGDGIEAIAQAELLQPDVILLDLSMPRMTGLEALPDIHRVAPAAKVIILSGFAVSIVEENTRDDGVVLYLQKGIEPEEILAAIESAAAGRVVELAKDGPGRN